MTRTRGGGGRAALPFLLACVAVAAACSGKVTQAGGLEVKIFTTNLAVGTDFDELKVDVSQETATGWKPKGSYDNSPLPSSFPFPTTIAVVAGSSSDQNTRITVTGLLGGNPVVRSEAQTLVPTDQLLELDMYLTRTCLNMLCASDATTCVNGTCTGIRVPTSMLVAYTPVDNGGGGPGGTGSSGGGSNTDASLNGHADGGTGGGSGGGVDSGTIGPVCDQTACPGCCDPKGGCVAPMSTCSNSMACTGPGGTCTGSSTCDPQMAAAIAASCTAGHGCYAGGCTCMTCAAGQSCNNGQCTSSGFVDAGGSCNAQSCTGGCCDANGACIPTGAVCPASGGTCSGTNGAACSAGGTSCASGGSCATGCCAGTGGCISVGAVCPNGKTCSIAGTTCQMAGMCGTTGQPCCPPSNLCASGSSCNGGVCSGGSMMSCNISSETVAGTPNLTANISGNSFTAADGFVVLSGSTSGPMQAMFYFTDYANACGYAMSNSAKSGGKYITFGVSQTSGSGYNSLIGSFVSGGANLGPALTFENASGSSCTTQYDVSGACGSGQLIIHITSASATSVVGYLSGACSSPDHMATSTNFTLPVCNTSLSVQGTSACCP